MNDLKLQMEYVFCVGYRQQFCSIKTQHCFLQLTGNEECLAKLRECLAVTYDIIKEKGGDEAWMEMSKPIKETTVIDMVEAMPGICVFHGSFSLSCESTTDPEELADYLSGELYYGDGYPHRLLVDRDTWYAYPNNNDDWLAAARARHIKPLTTL